ncbi:hypothetical protein BASA81_007928 [Batrachochytrium salamandrivorans]|nr:hypothetical protein BASA81_007928 [Batrachochytrium salamandrivorans]
MSKVLLRKQKHQVQVQCSQAQRHDQLRETNYYLYVQSADTALVKSVTQKRDREWAKLDHMAHKLETKRQRLLKQWDASEMDAGVDHTYLDSQVEVFTQETKEYDDYLQKQLEKEAQLVKWLNSLNQALVDDKRAKELFDFREDLQVELHAACGWQYVKQDYASTLALRRNTNLTTGKGKRRRRIGE